MEYCNRGSKMNTEQSRVMWCSQNNPVVNADMTATGETNERKDRLTCPRITTNRSLFIYYSEAIMQEYKL